jgi:hypothetical protein
LTFGDTVYPEPETFICHDSLPRAEIALLQSEERHRGKVRVDGETWTPEQAHEGCAPSGFAERM